MIEIEIYTLNDGNDYWEEIESQIDTDSYYGDDQ